MRKIKFRGKRLDNGRWITGYYSKFTLCDGQGCCSYIKTDGCQPVKVDPATVGQFTGLLDKDDKEIYEGDIIQHGYISYQYRIEYINSGFMCCKRPGEVCFSLFEADLHQVIGNIHDNPELLKTE